MDKKKNGNGNGKHWTDEEVEILKKMKEKEETLEAIAKELRNLGFERSIDSVKHKYQDLKANGYKNGDGKKMTWTTKEEEKLKRFLKEGTSLSDIYNLFPHRSKNSIRSKIKRVSLDKKFLEALLKDIEDYDEEEKKMWQEIYDLLTKDETKLKL
jgi:hypothetical protein